MKRTTMLLAMLMTAAIAMSVQPGGAAVKKRTLGVRQYEASGFILTSSWYDQTCDPARLNAYVDANDLRGEVPDDVPADVPAAPKRVPEPVGSQLPRECRVAPDRSIDQGGVEFPKIGGSTRTATVKLFLTDEAGTAVYFNLCQDLDGDLSCGESRGDPTNPDQTVNEPSVTGCSPGAPYAKVNTRYPVTVFVYSASTGCRYIDDGENTYIATRGTAKLVRYYI